MSSRRSELAELLRQGLFRLEQPFTLASVYNLVESERPDLADGETDQWGLKWRHDVRWEIETLVAGGLLKRRKELGRGVYEV